MNPEILADVAAEMRRADALHRNDYPDGTTKNLTPLAKSFRMLCDAKDDVRATTWADVLAEECAEVLSETDTDKLRDELVQVAAVSLRWIRSLDARSGADQYPELRRLTPAELAELLRDCEAARQRGTLNVPFERAVRREVDRRQRR